MYCLADNQDRYLISRNPINVNGNSKYIFKEVKSNLPISIVCYDDENEATDKQKEIEKTNYQCYVKHC